MEPNICKEDDTDILLLWISLYDLRRWIEEVDKQTGKNVRRLEECVILFSVTLKKLERKC